MNAIEAIMTRTSVRQFTDQPIGDDTLRTILKAGMSGPSCVNARDWSFIVVRDRDTLNRMADANGRPAEPLCGAALAVPGDAGFTAEISTTSGRVDMALPAKKTGNRYVCGDGSAQVSIHSTSGNVSVAAFQP